MIVSLPIYQQYHSRKIPFKVAVSSRRGIRNTINQDAYLALPGAGVFAVADGIGSRPCGEIASQLVMDTLEQWLDAVPQVTPSILNDAVQRANQRIFQRGRAQLEMRGMGCTFVLVWIDQPSSSVLCLHAGDSRAYGFRNGKLLRLTQDHSGENPDCMSRGITRAIGVNSDVDLALSSWDWERNDALLIISDGICDPLADHQIECTLNNRFVDGASRVQMLLDYAEQFGGNDDKTVMFILQ